jgi:hypothetical protein
MVGDARFSGLRFGMQRPHFWPDLLLDLVDACLDCRLIHNDGTFKPAIARTRPSEANASGWQ